MRRTKSWLVALSTVAVSSLLASTAAAQATNAKDGEFSVQRFQPAIGPRNFITVQGARTDGQMAWSAGLFVNYSSSPFKLKSCRTESNCDDPNAVSPTDVNIIGSMVTADAMASITPIPRVQIGLRLPVSYVNGDGIDAGTGTAAKGGLSGAGLGDPTLEAKFRAIGGVNDPIVVGLGVFGSGPVGHATAKDKYIGDRSPVVGARGILDFKRGPLSLGANLAGLYRGDSTLGSTTLGPEGRYGAAAGFSLSPTIRLVGEVFGNTKFSSKAGVNGLEADGALQVNPLNTGVNITVGGGAGIIRGVGVPGFRGFVGLVYVHEQGDTDKDGIPDATDKCPTDPEDLDKYQDEDGCPDPDNDADGVADVKDKCPNQPESQNGFEDEDGCPDEIPDRDKDGIADPEDMCPDDGGEVVRAKGPSYGCPDRDKDGVPDNKDACPDEQEDTDGFKDEDGCPDPDNDGDGVPDNADECVDVPGTKENRGCPDPDTDGDGIPDSKDKCKDKPETYNGYQDTDGCPDKAPGGMIEMTDDGIRLKEQVQFKTGSATITGAKSFKILDQVASVLTANKTIFLVEVAGHTDNKGNADLNKKLSKDRAEAVRDYLVKKGVRTEMLQAAGYGQEKPIADNGTKKGQEQNRRVEINILKSMKKKGDAPAEVPAAAP
jgi:OmpA-OmpF porin, OOP family